MLVGELIETIVEFIPAATYLILILAIYKKHKEGLGVGNKIIISYLLFAIVGHFLTGFSHFFYDNTEWDPIAILIFKLAILGFLGTLVSSIALFTYIFRQKQIKKSIYIGIVIVCVIGFLIMTSNMSLVRDADSVDLDLGTAKLPLLLWFIVPFIVSIMLIAGAFKQQGIMKKKTLLFGVGILISVVFKLLDGIMTTYALPMKLISMAGVLLLAYGELIEGKQ